MTQPTTPSLLSDSAASRDLLDFSPYTNTLLDIIRDPNTFGPLTIGVFGSWGSGKTSLMKFVHDDLRNDAARKFRLAWFDAWKYEKEDALWRALLLRVVDTLRVRSERDATGNDTTPKDLRQAIEKLEQSLYRDIAWEEKGNVTIDWSKVGKAAAGSAVRLSIAMLPGFASQAVEAAQAALGGGKDLENLFDAFQRESVKHHQDQLRSIEQFQKEFGDLVAAHIVGNNQRLVVFVDDLDRCLPEKAIEVLEAIKLFLDVPGCIFLLGLDQDVITRGIKVKYRDFAIDEGADSEKKIPIEGAAYLEKIIQLPFRLPKIEPTSMKPFVSGLAAFADARCADVFAEGLETNPRKVKRAINVFLFLSKLADRRAIQLQPIRLAKIVVIYHSHPALYDRLRKNPIELRDLEIYLRQQATTERGAERGVKPEGEEMARATRETPTAPAIANLLTDSLKRVLTLFLDDHEACFDQITYDELNSYFTLTRGTIAETPAVVVTPTAIKGELRVEFPVPTFIRIPAGEFLMGTSDEEIEHLLKTTDWAKKWKENGWFESEQPQHKVYLDEFQIAKYPVTNAQYQAFVQDAKHRTPGHWSGETFAEELASHPVVNVTWEDADKYCEWLTQKLRAANQLRENEVIRLPTEAEWEKVAAWDDEKKAHRIWAWGNEWDAAKCNSAESNIGTTTPVGKYSPGGDSFYGAADMSGNVWEWCADWHDENYYSNSPEKNPKGPGSRDSRVLRGGSWDSRAVYARCADRLRNNPVLRHYKWGFRCARSFSS